MLFSQFEDNESEKKILKTLTLNKLVSTTTSELITIFANTSTKTFYVGFLTVTSYDTNNLL